MRRASGVGCFAVVVVLFPTFNVSVRPDDFIMLKSRFLEVPCREFVLGGIFTPVSNIHEPSWSRRLGDTGQTLGLLLRTTFGNR